MITYRGPAEDNATMTLTRAQIYCRSSLSAGLRPRGHRPEVLMVRYAKHVVPVCENARDAPRETLLALLHPADMIHSPAPLLPHKAARAAPTAGGTTGEFRGAVITRDWLLCAVTDRSPAPALL